jgi:hypothetical protein
MQSTCPKALSAKSWIVVTCAYRPNDPKLSHGANNRKRELALNRKMKEPPPLAPARC